MRTHDWHRPDALQVLRTVLDGRVNEGRWLVGIVLLAVLFAVLLLVAVTP